jgi:putative ABC transport system permease protein
VEPEPAADRDALAAKIRDLFRGRSPEAWQPTLAAVSELAGGQPSDQPLANLWQSLGSALRNSKAPREDAAAADRTDHPARDDGSDSADTVGGGPKRNGSPGITEQPANNLQPSRGTDSTAELPVEVRSPDDWAGEFKRFSEDLDLFLLLMTSIGVTIAFVGIVNTMLMSVTERFIEFGILKANGWSNGEVLRLIAYESALLGLAGGVVGSVLGWIITQLINARWPTRIHLYASPQLLLFSLGFSTILGVVGGLYPALRASRMMPMDAIRRG